MSIFCEMETPSGIGRCFKFDMDSNNSVHDAVYEKLVNEYTLILYHKDICMNNDKPSEPESVL